MLDFDWVAENVAEMSWHLPNGSSTTVEIGQDTNVWLVLSIKYVPVVISNSYTMGCPPVRGDNPRALASGLSYVQEDKRGITILFHLHQCRPSTS